jgi:hypothetical protein
MPDEKDHKKIARFIAKICAEKFEPFIEKCYEELQKEVLNSHKMKISMKRESISDSAIWVAKKNYALNVYINESVEYEKPKVKVTGIKAVKSSTPAKARDSIRDSIKIMLTGKEEDFQQHVADFKKSFMNMSFEDISFPRGVSEVPSKIEKGTPINSKAAIVYNDLIKKFNLESQYPYIGNGDKIKFCYLKKENPYNCNVIASSGGNLPKEFKAEKYLDYEYQFDKVYVQAISGLLEVLNWNPEPIASLEDFFS